MILTLSDFTFGPKNKCRKTFSNIILFAIKTNTETWLKLMINEQVIVMNEIIQESNTINPWYSEPRYSEFRI